MANLAHWEQVTLMRVLPNSSMHAPFIDKTGQVDWMLLVVDRNAYIKQLEAALIRAPHHPKCPTILESSTPCGCWKSLIMPTVEENIRWTPPTSAPSHQQS